MVSSDIDLVIIWVDGNDKDWQNEKNHYFGIESDNIDAGDARYRDWGLLKYWFRSIEANVPWYRYVFFITNGQSPEWLNLNCNKLKFVKHSDYMPKDFLPTFSANPIEINLHRIKELSDSFIFFNDDTFIINPVEKNIFFRAGLPVYPAALHCVVPNAGKSEEVMSHIYVNDITMVNKYFSVKDIKKNISKWLNPFNVGLKNSITTLFEMQHSGFVGFFNHHLPVPIRKETISEIWEKEPDIMNLTSKNRFRSKNDVNQYIFRYWELARQSFYPINNRELGDYIVLSPQTIDHTINLLNNYTKKMICLNDSDSDSICSYDEFELMKNKLVTFFESRYPQKSRFEK